MGSSPDLEPAPVDGTPKDLGPNTGGSGEQQIGEHYERLLSEAERALDDVDHALERIDQGTYGTCEVCGAAIADDHLEARPTAGTCERHLKRAEAAP